MVTPLMDSGAWASATQPDASNNPNVSFFQRALFHSPFRVQDACHWGE